MAKYIPKKIPEGINVSKSHPLVNLLILVMGVSALLFSAMFILEMSSEWLSKKITYEFAEKISKKIPMLSSVKRSADSRIEGKVEELTNRLWQKMEAGNPDANITLKVVLIDNKEVNAFTFIGSKIGLTAGLVEKMKSENALSFVICHELGHFKNRHVLAGMGKGLALTILFGGLIQDRRIGKVLNVGINLKELSYSRKHETEADEYALLCLDRFYKHGAGFDGLFQELKVADKILKKIPLGTYMSTHPLSENRISHLKKIADLKGILLKGNLAPMDSYGSKID